MTWGSVEKFLFYKKKMTLARTSPINIYLDIFGVTHFHRKSLVQAMFEQPYFHEVTVHLKFRYCVCFEQEVLKL